MKKIYFLAAMAIAAAGFTACGNSAPKENLKSDVDSLSYAFGILHTIVHSLDKLVYVSGIYLHLLLKILLNTLTLINTESIAQRVNIRLQILLWS